MYHFTVGWSEEDQSYVGSCKEFPSLSWLARSEDEAMRGIKSLVTEVIADMTANNEPLPCPLP